MKINVNIIVESPARHPPEAYIRMAGDFYYENKVLEKLFYGQYLGVSLDTGETISYLYTVED